MSQTTQTEFTKLINRFYLQNQSALKLSSPNFENNGFITMATLCGSGGSVEIVCGPAEYHAEIYINTIKEKKRWCLADLMGIDTVKSWIRRNPPTISDKPRMELEIDYAFCLLVRGLAGIDSFEWLHA